MTLYQRQKLCTIDICEEAVFGGEEKSGRGPSYQYLEVARKHWHPPASPHRVTTRKATTVFLVLYFGHSSGKYEDKETKVEM
jgi:hypothetical protein